MYGNHFKDKFLIYFKDRDQQAFLDELNLNVNDGNSFKFKDFLIISSIIFSMKSILFSR